MARPLLASRTLQFSSSMPMTLLFVVLSVLSIFSVITFLCGTSKMKKLEAQKEEEATRSSIKNKLIKKLNSSLSNKAVSMVKMLSWRKVQAEEEEEGCYSDQDEEEALWRKNILMGERCRPIDFSGKIVHDSEGNAVPDSSDQNGNH